VAQRPDTIFFNGKITTLDRKNPEVSALALAGGTVAAIGSDKDMRDLAGNNARHIDLRASASSPV
jgi:predicted amidohydrolase YtcJ